MISISTLISFALGTAVVSASLRRRAAPPFFYFSFGDSYTTTGFDINGVQPAPGNPLGNPAFGQTMSSATPGTVAGGPNYVGFLATKYNSSYVSAYDFGVGGATISDSVVEDGSIPTFEQQVEQFFEPKYTSPHLGNWNSNNAIFSIFFGINDIGGTVTAQPIPDPSTRVPALLDAYFRVCDNLYQQGARRFMFVGVPPLDRSPFITMGLSQAGQTAYRDYVNDFNGQLAQRITQWASQNAGVVAATYDYHRWFTGVLDNPASLGFPDATCVNGDGQSCIWWNSYHVSSKLNDALAQRMQAAMNSLGFDGSVPVGGYFY